MLDQETQLSTCLRASISNIRVSACSAPALSQAIGDRVDPYTLSDSGIEHKITLVVGSTLT